MAKKKMKIGISTIVSLVAAVLALVAILMMFAPAAYAEVLKEKVNYTGVQLTFGYSEKVLGQSVAVFNFSANIIAYILAAVGIVFAILKALGKLEKISGFIAAGCFLVAGVFFFLVIPFCAPNVADLGDATADAIKLVKDGLHLGAGAIVAGILSLLAGLAATSTVFLKK